MTVYTCGLRISEAKDLKTSDIDRPRIRVRKGKGAKERALPIGRHRLQGDLGITAVLYTWGQKLDFHPHLHCIVTGGALSPDGKQWRSPKQRKCLFPVRAACHAIQR
jgi:hypothetical protein